MIRSVYRDLMPRKIRSVSTHIGDGQPAILLDEFHRHWPGLDLYYRNDDIRRPTDWRISDKRHTTIVHLAGHMDYLETELEGAGGSHGPAIPGEIWTVPAEHHYASHARGQQIQYAILLFDPCMDNYLPELKLGWREICPLAAKRDNFLHTATMRLLSAAREPDDLSEMLVQTLYHSILLHMVKGRGATDSDLPGAKNKRPQLDAASCRKLREFISNHLCDSIRLDHLAKITGMTTHQFLVAFRRAFGTTPGQYILDQRIRCAQQQLIESKKDITAIALDSGFSSHSHMTACFSKRVGCNPKSYRQTKWTQLGSWSH